MPLVYGGFSSGLGGGDATDSDKASDSQDSDATHFGSQDSDATHVCIHSDAATHVGGSALEEALEEFERISVGVETEGSFDGIEGRICGVYEAHERVIELIEAGAPLSPESQRLLTSIAASLEDCEEQGLSVGAKEEVDAVLACAKRIHGYKYDGPSERAMALAKLYMVGSLENLPEARRLLGIAASRCNAEAQNMLAAMHLRGDGGPKDAAEARRLYGLAAAQGYKVAQAALGYLLLIGQGGQVDYSEARRWFGLAADQGQAEAQTMLGDMFLEGKGGPTDFAEARRLLGLAAAQGEAEAQKDLGLMHYKGQGGPEDFTEARRLVGLAAAQGNASAQFMLGEMHKYGQGGPKDVVEARRLLELAVAQGHGGAQTSLAEMHYSGQGVPEDLAEAKRLFGLAAAQGVTKAQAALDAFDRDERAKKQAEADAMMAQLLAEDEEEKKTKLAKSTKSKRAKKKGGNAPAASTGVLGADGVEARDGLDATVEDGGESQPAVELGTAAHPAVSEPDVPVVEAQAATSPVPAAIGRASGRGRGGRGLGGGGDRQVQGATAAATGVDAVGAVAHLLDQASLLGPSDDGAAAPAAAAAPMALDMPPPPPAANAGATGARGRGRAPGSRGRGGRGLGGRGLGGRGGVVVGAAAHQTELGQASLQQVPEGSSYVDAALPVALAAPAPLDIPPPPPTAVTSLADAQFSTGRPEPPESTIGGQSTCIVCFANPKSHLAAPCGHQCACADCSAQMHECPVCRTRVQMWMQVRVA